MATGKLTATAIKNAKLKEKPYKMGDGGGMYLHIKPSGKYWRMDYRFGGKRKTLALGVYPDVSLKDARVRRDDARKLLANEVDPSQLKQDRKAAEADKDSFEEVAREWFAKQSPTWTEGHSSRIMLRLENDVFPWLGRTSIDQITSPALLKMLRRVENRGAIETAHRIKQNCGQVFRYGIATGRCERDPAADLKGALSPVKQTHHASVTDPKEIGKLLRDIDGYSGHFVTRCALQLAPLVFVRPGELRRAEWSEIDLDSQEWRIPAHKMKMRTLHIVPLSDQAAAILSDLHPLTGYGMFVFPGIRSRSRPMSNNTVNAALRRMGYEKGQATGHGFRSMASTLLNEQGWNHDAIERQLAHSERNGVRAAYNYAEYLPERRKMMQAWSDYLDGLKQGTEITPIRKKV